MNKIYHDIQIYSFTLSNYHSAISIVALMCQQIFRVTINLSVMADDDIFKRKEKNGFSMSDFLIFSKGFSKTDSSIKMS